MNNNNVNEGILVFDDFEEVEEIVTPSDWGTSDCCYQEEKCMEENNQVMVFDDFEEVEEIVTPANAGTSKCCQLP